MTSLDPHRLADGLAQLGIRGFANVACAILEPIAAALRSRDRSVAAAVEGEALAIAGGAWLGGRPMAALLQNSGLGNVVNPLSSLLLPYRIPVIMLVSWRGEPGQDDAAHHVPMGAATLELLDAFGVEHVVLREAKDIDDGVSLARAGLETRRPVALVVPRGAFGKAPRNTSDVVRRSAHDGSIARFGSGAPATRRDVLDRVVEGFGEWAVVSTTGWTSRALAARERDAPTFHMQGSMGFAQSIGLGVKLARPARPTLVLDGDGALIMRLGNLATAGALAPDGFVHVVLDDGSYTSTGGQPTSGIDFPAAALACGHRSAASCEGLDGLEAALAWAREREERSPALLRIALVRDDTPPAGRPALSPAEIADAFCRHLQGPP